MSQRVACALVCNQEHDDVVVESEMTNGGESVGVVTQSLSLQKTPESMRVVVRIVCRKGRAACLK